MVSEMLINHGTPGQGEGPSGGTMDAERLLRALGVSGKLAGFQPAAYMVERVRSDPRHLRLITKRLYQETASKFGVSAASVERNLRTVIRCCWRQCDRVFLEEIAGTDLWAPPTNSEFLDLLASHLRGLDQCGGAGP